MSQRDADLTVLRELLDERADELTAYEVEAFASMRFDLTAYPADIRDRAQFHQLTEKQRAWVTSVHARLVPVYENLVSRGLVAHSAPTDESRALDAMLAKPKVLKPPPRRRNK